MVCLVDQEAELKSTKKKVKFTEKEIAALNSRKHQTEIAIMNTKQKMLRDMEDFSRELATTKQNISHTQESILGSIRERLQATLDTSHIKTMKSTKDRDDGSVRSERPNQFQNEVLFMKELGIKSVDELASLLDRSEEQCFALYHEVQSKSEELEQVELENKHLETKLTQQVYMTSSEHSIEQQE